VNPTRDGLASKAFKEKGRVLNLRQSPIRDPPTKANPKQRPRVPKVCHSYWRENLTNPHISNMDTCCA
jgi:hypothetical protein